MADLWYYTSEGQPMDPISRDELKQLATRGILKPTDLVWTEGMPKWIRASSAEGLFAEGGAIRAGQAERAARVVPASEPAARPMDDEEDRRPRRRRERDRWEEEDEYEVAPRRRQRGMGAGAKVAIILGCVFGFLVIAGVVIFLIAGSGPQQPGNYSVSLGAQRQDSRRFEFKSGVQYRITVTSDKNSDVDILIFDNGNRIVAGDESIGPNSLVVWAPASAGSYRVDIRNLGPGGNRSHVKFEEMPLAQAPPPAFKPPDMKMPVFKDGKIDFKMPEFKPPNFNQPPINIAGKVVFTAQDQLTRTDPLDTVRRGGTRCKVYNVALTAAKRYSIVLESQAFDAFLRLEDAGRKQLAMNDDGFGIPGVFFGLNSHIEFLPPTTGNYRVVATSLRPSTGAFSLRVIER